MGWLDDFSTIHQGADLPGSWDPFGAGKRKEQRRADHRAKKMMMWQADFDRSRLAPDMAARVDAAKAAGLHPLAALGASPMGSSSVSVSSGSGSGGDLAGLPWMPSRSRKPSAADREMEALGLRRARADADLAETQVALARQRLAGQPGQAPLSTAPVGAVKVEPSEVRSAMPGVPYAEAGVGPAGQYTNTPVGKLWVPTHDGLTELEGLSYGLVVSDLVQRLGNWFESSRTRSTGQDMGYWQRFGKKVPRRMRSIQSDYHGGAYR